jgi:outer membrane protein assembly factor BamB
MARFRSRDRFHIGLGGHVVAIDASTGEEIWRTKLKGSTYTTIKVIGDRVYGGSNGELFCLDAGSGEILWHNKLKGLGLGIVAFGSTPDEAAMAAAIAAQQASAAAASGA